MIFFFAFHPFPAPFRTWCTFGQTHICSILAPSPRPLPPIYQSVFCPFRVPLLHSSRESTTSLSNLETPSRIPPPPLPTKMENAKVVSLYTDLICRLEWSRSGDEKNSQNTLPVRDRRKLKKERNGILSSVELGKIFNRDYNWCEIIVTIALPGGATTFARVISSFWCVWDYLNLKKIRKPFCMAL